MLTQDTLLVPSRNGQFVQMIAANPTDGTYAVITDHDYEATALLAGVGQGVVSTRSSAPFPSQTVLPVPTEGLPTDLGQIISAIFTWSLRLIGLVIFVRFFYAGFLWFTAAGNTTRTGKAQQIMKNAVYGTLILFSAWLILNTINPDLVKGTLTLPGLSGTSGVAPPPPDKTKPATCNDTASLAAKYNTPTTPQNDPKLTALISCIKSKLPGLNFGSQFTFEESNPLCNLTRGNSECGACSHTLNSCHYGGKAGTQGALAVDFGNEDNGDKIIEAAVACGTPRQKARCESASGATVSCSASSATHIHISEASCDSN